MRHLVCGSVYGYHAIAAVIGTNLLLAGAGHVHAATIAVPAGGDLQAALNAAQAGDVVTLQPGATYVGNFVLPNKGEIKQYIVVRSAASDSVLPAANIRMTPSYASRLPKIKSPSEWIAAMSTAPSANHWKLMFLEFLANESGAGEIIALGAADSTQTQLSQVPHHLIVDRVYVHGDPIRGQKRGVAVNSRDTSIINSYISDCKAVGQDSQAIQGHNGPGNLLIENNYLEAAGENFLLGGGDPVIPNLVTANVLFRRNYLSKPLAWRDPIGASPRNVRATVTRGGTLGAGTYGYLVAARTLVGQDITAVSAPSAEIRVTIPSGTTGNVVLAWTGVRGASDYLVYGRRPGAESVYWTTAAPTLVDSGRAGTSGRPAKPTRWSVKNILELKNARDVVVEGNVLENLWMADQSGYAFQLTPRNQGGHAPWSTVERVTIRRNLVRHTAGGVNILGHDNTAASRQANRLTIEHNLFDDMSAEKWGTGSHPVQIGGAPDAITINHNTFITSDSSIVYLYYGSPPARITNSAYTNNMSPHNAYGITGSGSSPGLTAILAFMPDALVTANVLAGGSASKYPAGNFFPAVAEWHREFVDYGGGNYRLASTSVYKGIGSDGADLGADVGTVMAHARRALAGDVTDSPTPSPPGSVVRLKVTTTSLAGGNVGSRYAATLSASGGSGRLVWSLGGGKLPSGLALSGSGSITGTPTALGSWTFTAAVRDSASPPNAATRTLTLTIRAREIALDTSGARIAGSAWLRVADTTAAAGSDRAQRRQVSDRAARCAEERYRRRAALAIDRLGIAEPLGCVRSAAAAAARRHARCQQRIG